jgi:hypothetical protein
VGLLSDKVAILRVVQRVGDLDGITFTESALGTASENGCQENWFARDLLGRVWVLMSVPDSLSTTQGFPLALRNNSRASGVSSSVSLRNSKTDSASALDDADVFACF